MQWENLRNPTQDHGNIRYNSIELFTMDRMLLVWGEMERIQDVDLVSVFYEVI